jgi:hypothetical protein
MSGHLVPRRIILLAHIKRSFKTVQGKESWLDIDSFSLMGASFAEATYISTSASLRGMCRMVNVKTDTTTIQGVV